MPAFWVYKCNSKEHEYQRTYGDWAEVFATRRPRRWGTTEIVPQLREARVGDIVIAYQTDRNELVGTARVTRWQRRGRFRDLILKPMRTIGVRVRPLKAADPRVARIPALQPGPIRTLYSISRADASALLKAAGVHLRVSGDEPEDKAERAVRGAGFGTPEQNKRVERAAVRHVKGKLRAQGWSVRDVSPENRGYDLFCKRAKEQLHVEVKGASGEGQQFPITARELRVWSTDQRFALALVGSALSAKPIVSFFPGPKARNEFEFRPLSYMVTRRPNSTPHRTRA